MMETQQFIPSITRQQASNICSQASSTKQVINHRGVFKWETFLFGWRLAYTDFDSFPSTTYTSSISQVPSCRHIKVGSNGFYSWISPKIKRNNRIQLNMVQPNDSIHTRIHQTAQLPVHKKVIVQVFTVISIQQFPKAILSRWRSHNKTPNIIPLPNSLAKQNARNNSGLNLFH